ncbi:hypothetical protein CRENBAI_010908 [Crenichthys baileyi]|uniref:Uncharacterized protein n=1 Tax=Crenichthys baileyi TaxID=28760 RepID=A0AAV9S7L4_9TELE
MQNAKVPTDRQHKREIIDAVVTGVLKGRSTCGTLKPHSATCRCCVFDSCTAAQFLAVFNQIGNAPEPACSESEEITSWFYSTCHTVLDSVAPLKIRQPKTKSGEPG